MTAACKGESMFVSSSPTTDCSGGRPRNSSSWAASCSTWRGCNCCRRGCNHWVTGGTQLKPSVAGCLLLSPLSLLLLLGWEALLVVEAAPALPLGPLGPLPLSPRCPPVAPVTPLAVAATAAVAPAAGAVMLASSRGGGRITKPAYTACCRYAAAAWHSSHRVARQGDVCS